jgi:L-lactate dehydrogenase complex protein LldG
MLLSGADTYTSASLLPETHSEIVCASRIVAAMEDAFALARKERGELPRAANFISGPSRTGDIEQTIVLGAHGPYRAHVIAVREACAYCLRIRFDVRSRIAKRAKMAAK